MANVLGFGANLSASLAFYDRDSSSWKTYQQSFLADGNEWLGRWPTAGMTRSGQLYRLKNLAHRFAERGFSLWPSPLASDMKRLEFSIDVLKRAPHKKRGRRNGTEYLVEATAKEFGGYPHPEFAEWLMGFPRGWTDIDYEASETPSLQTSLSGLVDAS